MQILSFFGFIKKLTKRKLDGAVDGLQTVILVMSFLAFDVIE